MEISCVIPAFESADLVRRCLRSAIAQSEVALEIIVSDDSVSTEIRGLVATFPTIRYVEGARSGNPVDNWNHGLAAAQAPLAVLMHQDEAFADPLFLRRAVDAMRPDGVAAVVGTTRVTGVNRTSRFALASALFRRAPARIWWLPMINWVGPTAALVFRNGVRFDPALVQLVDIDFYRRVLATGRLVRLDWICVDSLGHHGASITARIDPAARARADLAVMAARSPPGIGRVQHRLALAMLAARGWRG